VCSSDLADDPGAVIDLGDIPGAAVPVSITVFNAGANTVFLTPGGLDAVTGYPILPGAVIRFSDKFDSNDAAELFCADGPTICSVHVDQGGVTDMQVLIKPADSLDENLSLSHLLFSALGVYKIAAAPAPTGTTFTIEPASGGPIPTISTMLDGQQMVMLSGATEGRYDLIQVYLNGNVTHASTFTPAAGDLVSIGTAPGKIGDSSDEPFQLTGGVAGHSLFNAVRWTHEFLTRTHRGTDIAAANGADTVAATADTADCLINGFIVYANGAQTGDLTELAVMAGPGKVQTLIPAANLQQADLDAEGKAVSVDLGRAGYLLKVGETIVIEHVGTGAAPLSVDWVVTYTAATVLGSLV
jgi:hypothetical protein